MLHAPWRKYLDRRLYGEIGDAEYEYLFKFTDLRNSVAHGRILFPTYRKFKEHRNLIAKIGEFIGHLENYLQPSGTST